MIAGDDSENENEEVILSGYEYNASDMIHKPLDNDTVIQRVNNAIKRYSNGRYIEGKVEKQNRKLIKQYKESIECYNNLLDILQNIIANRQIEARPHILRVAEYSRILATHYAKLYPRAKMTKKKINLIAEASKMHDVGKITMPDALIQRPGKLSKQELDSLMEHTLRGSEIMEVIGRFRNDDYGKIGYNICKYHHAKYDGNGYPYGTKDNQIPIEAQIVSLADIYDVLIHEPINNHLHSEDEAFHILMEGKCGELAPRMKECLASARMELEMVKLDD